MSNGSNIRKKKISCSPMNFELKYVIDTPAQKQPSSLQVAVLFCEPWKSKIIKMIVPNVG